MNSHILCAWRRARTLLPDGTGRTVLALPAVALVTSIAWRLPGW